MHNSGKLLILGIVALALLLAAASWLFRYSATHRAAQFWGPTAAQLIRDAPTIDLVEIVPGDDEIRENYYFELESGHRFNIHTIHDVSNAPGITHLRNALLEDRSYVWPARQVVAEPVWKWVLGFRDEERVRRVFVFLNEDCTEVTMLESGHGKVLSSTPISAGLIQIFDEMSQKPTHSVR